MVCNGRAASRHQEQQGSLRGLLHNSIHLAKKRSLAPAPIVTDKCLYEGLTMLELCRVNYGCIFEGPACWAELELYCVPVSW
jgi:hypothetical protein